MLKRITKVVSVSVVIACLVVCLLPVHAFAVDPMSATMMANAFAQAVAAYGASNGVSMTFDVANTDGIGEGVHELWKDFREANNESDDYDSMASAFQATNPYGPKSVNIAGQTMKVVGVDIDSTLAPVLDDFYNWLLTGPAEMVQVDNQYYEFSQAQIGPNAISIPVGYGSYIFSLNGNDVSSIPYSWRYRSDKVIDLTSSMSNPCVFFVNVVGSATTALYVCFASTNQSSGQVLYNYDFKSSTVPGPGNYSSQVSIYYRGFYWGYSKAYWNTSQETPAPLYSYSGTLSNQNDFLTMITSLFDLQADGNTLETTSDVIGVKAYDDAGIADIPDTADPNYDALTRSKSIPLDVPWDDTMFGDGTGTLTDAQTQAIADDIVSALEAEGEVELADERVDPGPEPAPDEVILPFIPVNLPSFNFNFAGIWHYVREWVASLGSWFTAMFAIWAILPYAMIVPVYATAVVIIVLGVYKRFFM